MIEHVWRDFPRLSYIKGTSKHCKKIFFLLIKMIRIFLGQFKHQSDTPTTSTSPWCVQENSSRCWPQCSNSESQKNEQTFLTTLRTLRIDTHFILKNILKMIISLSPYLLTTTLEASRDDPMMFPIVRMFTKVWKSQNPHRKYTPERYSIINQHRMI